MKTAEVETVKPTTASVKMRKAVAAPPPPRTTNGHGSTSVSEDSDSTSGESLEGLIELSVMLPNDKCVRMSTEKRTPMMDLLVQVTKANGLSPGSFVLDVKSERSRDSIRYKPSTAVGSLNTSVVYVVAKSSIRDVSLVRKDTRTGNPPFEKTFRLRVHLPRNQLHVLRVSQTTPLVDVFSAICTERELNSSRYELRHPVHTEEKLDPQRCLADYGLTEVAIVAVKAPSNGFSRSSSDIMSLQHDDDRKKSRFFGFMFKKSKSVSRSIGDASSDGHSSRGVSPARSDGSGCQSISPPPSTAGYPAVNGASHNNNNNNNNNKASKKRAAPPPPKPVAPKQAAQEIALSPSQNGNELTATSHSRHSSDSSGYHEASILSDSLDAAGQDIENLSESKVSTPNGKKEQAPSNLTTVNSTSMASVTSGPKKRKAPPPPLRSISTTSISNGQGKQPETPPVALENNVPSRIKSENPPEEFKTCNGKSVHRKDSVSSHASSTSEEIRSVISTHKKAPAPVPLPRQSKSPAPMPAPLVSNEEKRTNAKESEGSAQSAVNGLNGDVKSLSDFEQPAERHQSFGEIASGRKPNGSNGVAEAFSELHVVNLNTESVRRMSSSSTVSSASSRKSVESEVSKEKQTERPSLENSISVESETKSISRLTSIASCEENDIAASSRRSSVLSEASSHSTAISESSNTKNGNPVTRSDGDSVQKLNEVSEQTQSNSLQKRQEVSVQTHFDDNDNDDFEAKKDSRRSSVSSGENYVKEASGSSSRKSSCSHSESGNREDLVQPEAPQTKQDVADNVTFGVAPLGEPDSVFEHDRFALNNDAVSEFYNHFNSRKKFVTQSWAQYVNASSSTNTQETRTGEDWVLSDDDEELSSLDENRNSDAMSDFPLQEEDSNVGTLTDKDLEDNNRHILVDSTVSDSLQTSPKLNKARSMELEHQHRVKEADVTALSAQIDKSMSEHRIAAEIDEAFASIDSMETGSDSSVDDKHRVCETAQSSEQTSISEADPVITWEYRIPEVPAQFANDYDEKQSAQQDEESDEIVQPVELPMLVKEQVRQTEMTQPKGNVTGAQETQEHIFKRPVMSFSISTYRSRVEEESEYGRKLVKAEPPPSQKVQLTKSVSVVENPTFPKPVIQAKPRLPELTPGHSLSIAKAITKSTKPAETEVQSPAVGSGMRKAKSEMHLSGHLAAPAAVGSASGSTPEEQERLQQEYLKLHSQFLQWQQQLLQNQTVLQQQQILPESATETLQRIQELHQQFMSLPVAQQQQQSTVEAVSTSERYSQKSANFSQTSMDFAKKTNSLPRPKSTFAMPPSTESKSDFSNSLERKQPRVGPRPWMPRPVTVSLGSWQPRNKPQVGDSLANSSEPTIIIENKPESKRQSVNASFFAAKTSEPQKKSDVTQVERVVPTKNAENVPRSISIKERVSTFNATNNDRPAPVVSRQASQPSFSRCPVVKGFANVEPAIQQQKSRVIVNSAPKPNGPVVNGNAAANQQKPVVARVEIKPQTANQQNGKPVANTFTYFGDRVDAGSVNKPRTVNSNHMPIKHDNKSDAMGKITVNAMNQNNNNTNNKNNNNSSNNNSNKNYTTVVVNAAPSRQQNSVSAPPPPPPPPKSLEISHAKVGATSSNGQANRRSVSSPESDEDKRDVLMMAIRGFGGRTGLKKVSSSETGWQARHGNL